MKNENVIKICILGGGNIGTLLLADLSRNKNVITLLHTSRPELWKKHIQVLKPTGELDFIGKVDVISNDPEATIGQADVIISTLPTNVLMDSTDIIKKHIKKGAMLGFIPGSGGKEFLFKDLISSGHVVFGFQRVHAISRISVYGESVYNLGRKDELFFGSIPSKESNKICKIFEKILKVKCHALPNYLSVTLVPSNQILHTSRLYSMFKNYCEGKFWNKETLFYKEWTDADSKVLLSCDRELQSMLLKLKNLDTSYIKSLKEHYGVENYKEMTVKISNIPAFSGIKSPMIQKEYGFIPDFNSRYFKEDFPFGLCVIRGFAEILNHKMPSVDRLLKWYEKNFFVSFYAGKNYDGESLKSLSLPQNFGIKSLKDIADFYE
ncbi:MAG: hypothetical protein GX816_02935 [Erysipelotrichia bacterium]|jgi:hypothetical protein|nr:hypothetical protein [Erysipelotrichia bacterium]